MVLKIDVLKQIKEFIDWVSNKIKDVKTAEEKEKLVTLMNSISTLVSNKQEYLNKIQALENDKVQQEKAISNALKVAQTDTENLLATIKSTGLNTGNLGFALNNKLQVLANIKSEELERFKLTIGMSPEENTKIVEKLASYNSQWMEIGEQVDKLKKELK